MKITVLGLSFLLAIISDFGDAINASSSTVTSSNYNNNNNNNNGKRESSDQGVSGTSSSQSYQQTQLRQSLGSYASPTTAQFVYAKPEGAVQYAQTAYRGPVVTPAQIIIPQFAYAQHGGEVRPGVAASSPYPIAYAHPGASFAIALGGHGGPAGIPYHPGQPIQFALAPFSVGPQHFGQLVKSGGVAYTSGPVPQFAFLAAAAPQQAIGKVVAAAPTQQAVSVQPTAPAAHYPIQAGPVGGTTYLAAAHSPYGYAFHPSLEFAAGRQLYQQISAVPSPTVEPPQQYKQLSAPTPTSYASFSQHLPIGASIKVSRDSPAGPVAPSQQQQQQSIYPTAATPYSGGKVSYRSINQALADSVAGYSQPGAIHYGTHLYHPALAKYASLFGGVPPKYL